MWRSLMSFNVEEKWCKIDDFWCIYRYLCITTVVKPKNLGTFRTGLSKSLTNVLRLLSITPSSTVLMLICTKMSQRPIFRLKKLPVPLSDFLLSLDLLFYYECTVIFTSQLYDYFTEIKMINWGIYGTPTSTRAQYISTWCLLQVDLLW